MGLKLSGFSRRYFRELSFPSNFVFQGSRTAEVGSIGRVAEELGLVEQTLRNWVKAAKAGTLHPAGAKAITPEQMELSRLRAENARLKLECAILKKATAYFAKDTL